MRVNWRPQQYLSAITYVHKLQGLPDPTKTFIIQKLLTAVHRSKNVGKELVLANKSFFRNFNSIRRFCFARKPV